MKTQLDALKESIDHWKHELSLLKEKRYSEIQIDGDNCPLCQFNTKDIDAVYRINCNNCLIANYTGRPSCKGTPYYDASEEYELCFLYTDDSNEIAIAEFERMIEFLENLYEESK